MTPLRWLLMAGHVPAGGSLGGVVRYTTELARALGRRDDVELHLTCRQEAVEALAPLVQRSEHLHVLPVPSAASLAEPWLVRAAVGADLLATVDVAQGAKHLLPAAPRALRVLTVHDLLLLDRPSDFGAAKRHLLGRPYRAALESADVSLCVSRATRDRLAAWASPAAVQRAVVTPLACSTSLRRSVPDPVEELVGRRFLLVVGDPTPRKNVPVVVEAFAEVSSHDPGAVLVLVGPPSWGRSTWGEQLDVLERRGALLRATGVSDGTLRWLYENARGVLCPSVAEGFGLPVVEALAFGAPVVTSTDPALVEAAAGAAHAVLAPHDPAAWARAAVELLASGQRVAVAAAIRTWDDVADDAVAAVRAAIRPGRC